MLKVRASNKSEGSLPVPRMTLSTYITEDRFRHTSGPVQTLSPLHKWEILRIKMDSKAKLQHVFGYLWVFKIYFDSRHRKNQSSVESDWSSRHRSIELFSIFEPLECVDVCAILHCEKAKEMNSLAKNHIGWNFHSVNHKWSASWKRKKLIEIDIHSQ